MEKEDEQVPGEVDRRGVKRKERGSEEQDDEPLGRRVRETEGHNSERGSCVSSSSTSISSISTIEGDGHQEQDANVEPSRKRDCEAVEDDMPLDTDGHQRQ